MLTAMSGPHRTSWGTFGDGVELVLHEHAGSYVATVETEGGEKIVTLPRLRRRVVTDDRLNHHQHYLSGFAERATPKMLHNPDIWRLNWSGCGTDWEKQNARSSRRMEAATARHRRWHGSLDHSLMVTQGFVHIDTVFSKRDAKKLRHWIEYHGEPDEADEVHGAWDSQAGCVSLELLSPEEAMERKKDRAKKSGVRLQDVTLEGPERQIDGGYLQARDRIARAIARRAGMPDSIKPFVEVIYAKDGARQPPQKWHGDHLIPEPQLAAAAGLSREWVPPLFPALHSAWGAGGELRYSPHALSEKKGKHYLGKTELEGLTMLEARKARWHRVYQGGDNNTVKIATASPSGAELGLTAGGKASAVPRKTMYGDPSRRKGKVRPKCGLGSVTYFDSTGPHRGPGVADGEHRRCVLYLSWAGRKADAQEYAACLAFPPETGEEGRDYHLVYKDGEYQVPP